ncbi:nucleotidyltransferase domain-containing protein [Candidatus Wolfebacteria bacterium]|nr:nucleotidyltransferase domain-containing protein [Candidatus Wolfebacteria bacterium]
MILEILFNNPEQPRYLREIGKIIGKEPGVFQRDINKLTEEGLLESFYQANSRFFKINKKHHLFKELKAIFFKTLGIEGVLKKELKKIKGIKEAFLYGSFAQKKEKNHSDVDIFVIGSMDEDDLADLTNHLEKRFGRDINYILMAEKEFLKKKKEKNSFLSNVLNNKIIKLI